MKTLYLDCSMGIAGDMFAAALLELIDDKSAILDKLNHLGLPKVSVSLEPAQRCGIAGSRFHVDIDGAEEGEGGPEHGHAHSHDHGHEHSHHHAHHSMDDIRRIVYGMTGVSDAVKDSVMAVYSEIAGAESAAHGAPVSEIHFHEVGALDAVVDVTAVCLLMETLAPDRVVSSPVNMGSGMVRCAHGVMPVPTPATALLLKGIPAFCGDTPMELCTPTGAALVRYFSGDFRSMPEMSMDRLGYGMGTKEIEGRLNALRVILGEEKADGSNVVELVCNLDDMTPEDIGFAMEQLFATGALDVWTTAIGMKKCRPGTMLSCLCHAEKADDIIKCFFTNTSTLGIRQYEPQRHVLTRRSSVVETELGRIRVKQSYFGQASKSKPEFDDMAAIAAEHGKSLCELRTELSVYPQMESK